MNPKLPDIENPESLPMVVLASASPRRRAMFREIGVRHTVLPATVDDGLLAPGDVDPNQWVAALAYFKAASSAQSYAMRPESDRSVNTVVIGADTVCVHDGRILGQPNDRDHAQAMIRSMSDAQHEVLTGIAIVDPVTGRRELFVDCSVVNVGQIEEHEITTYLESGQWKGKAGAYNITERLAAGWPIEFDGDETSIVGLPMTRTLQRVEQFYI
jgi:nucleoside triphosphate pyrophosphatase